MNRLPKRNVKVRLTGRVVKGPTVLIRYPDGHVQSFGPFTSRLTAIRWKNAYLKELKPRWAGRQIMKRSLCACPECLDAIDVLYTGMDPHEGC